MGRDDIYPVRMSEVGCHCTMCSAVALFSLTNISVLGWYFKFGGKNKWFWSPCNNKLEQFRCCLLRLWSMICSSICKRNYGYRTSIYDMKKYEDTGENSHWATSVCLLSEYLENSAFCDTSLSVWTIWCDMIELTRSIKRNIFFLQHVNLIIRFLSSQLTLHIVNCLICLIYVKKKTSM